MKGMRTWSRDLRDVRRWAGEGAMDGHGTEIRLEGMGLSHRNGGKPLFVLD